MTWNAELFESLLQAATQGDTESQCIVGMMYASGKGVPQDYAEALKWFLLAAEQGDPDAQTNLGVVYEDGLGVPQDYAEALKWYRLAAEQGDSSAQFELGIAYSAREGVEQDYEHAHKWLNLAVSTAPEVHVEEYAKTRDEVADKMTSEQIAEAQRLAREWKPRTWEELKGK